MEKNNTHLSGEYFVAAELYRRGYSVGMTIGNAKAIDLFVNYKSRTVSIQVKAIKDIKSSGWPMMKRQIKNKIICVFINLNRLNPPEYFIATPTKVRRKIKEYETRGIVYIGDFKKDNRFINRWNKLKSNF